MRCGHAGDPAPLLDRPVGDLCQKTPIGARERYSPAFDTEHSLRTGFRYPQTPGEHDQVDVVCRKPREQPVLIGRSPQFADIVKGHVVCLSRRAERVVVANHDADLRTETAVIARLHNRVETVRGPRQLPTGNLVGLPVDSCSSRPEKRPTPAPFSERAFSGVSTQEPKRCVRRPRVRGWLTDSPSIRGRLPLMDISDRFSGGQLKLTRSPTVKAGGVPRWCRCDKHGNPAGLAVGRTPHPGVDV